ncbi:unnamed protein product [Choristocarpus tenellus]
MVVIVVAVTTGPVAGCRDCSANDLSRVLDGVVVNAEDLSEGALKAMKDQAEGVFVVSHTPEGGNGRSFFACVWKGRTNNIAAMINKSLLPGLKLEMQALGVYVPAEEPTSNPAARSGADVGGEDEEKVEGEIGNEGPEDV